MNQVVCFMSCRIIAVLFLRSRFSMTSEAFSPQAGMVRLWYVIIRPLTGRHVTSILLYQQWDLDTGQITRRFVAHSAQLAALAVRPLSSDYPNIPPQFSQIKTTPNLSASIDHGRLSKPSHSATGDDPSSHTGAPTGRRPHVETSPFTVHMAL